MEKRHFIFSPFGAAFEPEMSYAIDGVESSRKAATTLAAQSREVFWKREDEHSVILVRLIRSLFPAEGTCLEVLM